MFIETEQTPNPATLKFLPGRTVMVAGTADFASPDEAARSPLAERLFQVDGVQRVFLGQDFISISKAPDKEWFVLKPAILGVIMEHFIAGKPVLLAGAAPAEGETADGPQSEVVAQIKELLETPGSPGRGPGRRRHYLPQVRERGRLSAHARRMLRVPQFDRDLENGHREHASALRSRSRRGAPR